jgi:hypothetical protein
LNREASVKAFDYFIEKNYILIYNMDLIKSFCGGSRGAIFSKRAPLAAGGKYNESKNEFK